MLVTCWSRDGSRDVAWPGHFIYKCHGASCLQANDAEGRKNDQLKEKEGEGI